MRVGSDKMVAIVGGVSGKLAQKSGTNVVGGVVSVRHLAYIACVMQRF